MTPEDCMRRAIELSRTHMEHNHGGPFGAVIIRDGGVIADGWNCVTSTNDPTAHAEVDAIRKACRALGTYTLTGCQIYTSCEPCPMCLAAVYWARLDRIYYANTRSDAAAIQFDDQLLYDEMTVPTHQRKIPMQQLLRDDAQQVFTDWTNKTDRQRY